MNVEHNVTSVTVTATLQDTNASMEVNGQETSSGQAREIFLGDEGSSTNITIRVNPPNGNAKTYRITVHRASKGDNGNNDGDGTSVTIEIEGRMETMNMKKMTTNANRAP